MPRLPGHPPLANDLDRSSPCPACHQPGRLRPHVVWFGETPLHLPAIEDALLTANAFVAIGTSGSVYPVAGFVAAARDNGVPSCELNLHPSDNRRLFDTQRYGPATEIVSDWVNEVLGDHPPG